MTYKEFTDEEIVKAVECCSEPCCVCEECPLYCVGANCSSFELHRYALDLINRQKTEIEELNIQLRELWNIASLYKAEGEKQEGYNKNLLTANTALSNEILSAKAKAYKEFADRLKRSTVTAVIGNEIYDVATSKGVDNLLEEMVGEEIL